MAEAIKRSKVAQFINTGSTTSPTWSRMGTGIADNSIGYSASVVTETFIHEDNASNSVDSFAPTIPVTQYAYKGDAVFDFVDGLRKVRATGTDADTEILLVYIYDYTEDESTHVRTYVAEKNNCSIQIDSFGGAGGQRAQIGYNVLFNGDPILGTATITSGVPTFTAN